MGKSPNAFIKKKNLHCFVVADYKSFPIATNSLYCALL